MSSQTPSLPASLEKIINRFERISENRQRYEQLLWYAKRLPAFPEVQKTPDNKVWGCISQVYISAKYEAGKLWFQGDADAQIVKGFVALLIAGFNGLTPAEILEISPDFIQKTGLNVSLTPSRVNGFYNIFQLMQTKAKIYQQLISNP
jgi:cysteine desulfuration protein SufE